MEAVKRIEVVAPEMLMHELTDMLERHQVTGYTLAQGLSGRGDRGIQSAGAMTGGFANIGLIVVCSAVAMPPLLDELRPMLARYGGMCLVSDALWLRH